MGKKEYTYEVCPYCGEEVKLDAELKVQVCPNCGKHIVGCSMCLALSDSVSGCCVSCPLEYLAHKMNGAKEELENSDSPSTFKKLIELKNELGAIMNATNGHDKHLVELLNECWDKKPWDVRGMIMKSLYFRDYDECIDKEIFTSDDTENWWSNDWDWEKYAYDYLMKVADDTDILAILHFLRVENK